MSVSSLSPDTSSFDLPPIPSLPTETADSAGSSAGSSEGARNRSFFVTWILSLALGFLGADRFYTGRYATGALKLVTLGGLGLWWIVDLVIVMAGGLRSDRRRLRGYDAWKEVAWIATGFLLIVGYSLQLDELVSALLTQLL
ncbi:TM2 domain-containing protein [Brevibacterium marinum]|uniref:TM2 domain-containing membrane protein YozV n=1 Tax=Brevibacterium marinum TaxID=418643 RepID=A0A846RYY3_9MICO|nr:TM2 domain-containing protein [Brevibacterium marinum]NJC55893.1 TM2 domain-containing membrane protein YozV [Brevibacterium marinum]